MTIVVTLREGFIYIINQSDQPLLIHTLLSRHATYAYENEHVQEGKHGGMAAMAMVDSYADRSAHSTLMTSFLTQVRLGW